MTKPTLIKRALFALALAAAASPSYAADYYIVVPVENRAPTLAITVSLNPQALPDAIAGQPYPGFNFSSLLQVQGDPAYTGAGVTFAVAEGALPTGMTLDAKTGILSGTPSAGGTSPFSVRATYMAKSGQQAYQVVTTVITVTLASAALPTAKAGMAYAGYDFKPLVRSSDSGFSPTAAAWSVVGALPAGLTLSATGVLSGTPTSTGTSPVTLKSTYRGVAAEQTYNFTATDSALTLSGAGYARVPQNLPNSANWSVEAWVSLASGPSYAGGVLLADADSSNGNDMLVGVSATHIYARADKPGSAGTLTGAGWQGALMWAHGKTLGNTQHHIVWSAGSGQFNVYIDGQMVVSTTATLTQSGYHNLVLGGFSDNGGASRTYPFYGTISEMRYFNSAVSASEVAAMYAGGRNRAITPSTVAAWKFNDGGGSVASDATGKGYQGTLSGSFAWPAE